MLRPALHQLERDGVAMSLVFRRCECGNKIAAPPEFFSGERSCVLCGRLWDNAATEQEPSASVRLGNAAQAVARVTAAVARGEAVLVDRDEKQTRRAVCGLCPANVGGRCADCGCWIRAKSLLATEDCPRALWPARISAHGSTETEPARVERGAPEAGGAGRGV